MQLMLFADLPIPEDAAEHLARRSRMCFQSIVPWRSAVMALGALLQREIVAPLRELDRDDIPEPMPVHNLVKAADAEPLKIVGVSSIFGMADAAKAARVLRQFGRFGAAQAGEPAPYRVERSYADGSTRVIRQRPEETEEWQERERARRAKQRPPKPTARAKTRGKKVRAWDGEGEE